jgi:bacillithiol biosynthesis cysteine-adding enzyme BshC
MECHCLRFSEVPHTTKLFSAFLEHFDRVERFYAHPPDEAGVQASAREVRLDAGVRRAVVEVLREQNRGFGADATTDENLERLNRGAEAIVTGQQVGFFTGPAYSFYKALSAIRWAQHLTEQGTDAVPIFWLATEDHDLAEVNHCFWLTQKGLVRHEVGTSEEFIGRRVGEVPLGKPVEVLVDAAATSLSGAYSGEVERALRESYRPEETFGSAFGKLMMRLLAGRGIILLDPLDERLHRLAAPVFRGAVEHTEELTVELLARNKTLEGAGYHAQVKVAQRSTLLFFNVDGRREPLRRRNDHFVAGRLKFSAEELVAAVGQTPELFTPNVLLRPVVQDALLPTAAYIGGPAEIAYMAQAEVAYRRLLGRMPAILPRASFTLVESHVERLLKKYGLEIGDVLRGRQYLRAKMAQQFLPRGLAQRFASGDKSLRQVLQGLRQPMARLDKTLLGAVDMAERKMRYQFAKLRGKAGRAENVRTGLLDRDERVLLDSLYPHRGLQERTLCFLPLLAAHGPELLDQLSQRAAPGGTQHQVVLL